MLQNPPMKINLAVITKHKDRVHGDKFSSFYWTQA